MRNVDGGWGLNRPFTGPGGVENPAGTTYIVTDCDHVGSAWLELYAQGLVPKADLQTLVAVTMTTQTCTFPAGKAIAYSRLPGQTGGNDNVTTSNGRNVHNVNAGAAWFLQHAQDVGCAHGGLNRRINDITAFEVAEQDRATGWWSYKGTGVDADTDHTAYQADAMYGLCYPLASETAYQILHDGHDDKPTARIAWARLAGLPPGIGRTVDGTTQWLVMADQWMPEVADFVATATTQQKAQLACWAARAADQAEEVL
jgi:hypothetical protein